MSATPAHQHMVNILTSMHALLAKDATPIPTDVLASRLGLSRRLVRYHLTSMERLGLVQRVKLPDSSSGWLLGREGS